MKGFWCGIDTNLADPIITGEGTAVVISGWCYHEEYSIKEINIIVGKRNFKAQSIGNGRFDVLEYQVSNGNKNPNGLTSGFWAIVNFPGVQKKVKEEVYLKVILQNNNEIRVNIGKVTLLPNNKVERILKKHSRTDVAICMATYNPKLELFKRQIESIINQSYKNWICIINDDCSSESIFKEMKEIVKIDERFILKRNDTNLGFYYNFEKCISLVPYDIKYIALSDQDDYWHKNKLQLCIDYMDDDTSLVYSDMNIVSENGKLISNTYWSSRRNNFNDLEALILANTITGAASLFKASLLNKILPFPRKIGDSYHDWWIGLCAFMAGNIKYIDSPLYDYIQHGSNVIGQCKGITLTKRINYLVNDLKANYKHEIKRLIKEGKAIYEYDYKRILLNSNILFLRFNNFNGRNMKRKLKIVKKLKKLHSVISLLKMYIMGCVKGRDTMHAELRLAHALISDKIIRYSYKKRKGVHLQNILNSHAISLQKNELNVDPLGTKIAPIKLHISKNQKERVNIIIPTIDFKYFFGGYLGKFNLALKLAKSGLSVRFVIIDYCDFKPNIWKEEIKKYPGLERFFNYVEVEYLFDRSKELWVNQNDRFVATTWWSAYVANEAVKKMDFQKFLYLIQEYEPLTFNHGSYFALADETYNFSHYALFSTELLREYFKENRLGVFRENIIQGEKDSISFENAILSFQLNRDTLKKRKKKKLLLYARPEAHAARNMFELAILSLKKAVENGVFDINEWEFYGMGSVSNYSGIKITDKVKMKILPKMSLDKYKETIKNFDLGISLMYTPHPSLVPLEMAAAGMLVVTNSYSNKTEEKMKQISTNIIVAKPNLIDIANKIKYAVSKVDDIESRLRGSNVNWSSDWDKTFNKEIMGKILFFLKN